MNEAAKTGSSIKKISGGKLIRMDVVYSNQIERVKITGDFFLHPEELITDIEESLAGAEIPILKNVLVDRVEAILNNNSAVLIGFSPDDLISVLMDAIQ
ncbi:MAG: lipoate protein ligase C-terminal domain-containing protein [Anaerolineaceae bacterium]|nr:lipoate protein ligase C-terminal domain-containing protein [Anaerolineaceae bacterium]